MHRITLTGANGFVGRALCAALVRARFDICATVRSSAHDGELCCPVVPVGEIDATTAWHCALVGTQAVVHLAARAHVMRDSRSDALAIYRKVNVEGTLGLARQAVSAGVRRFIFMSSIKVNGEATGDRPFSEADEPHPSDAYGISKLEAERALQDLCARSGMELTILRPPLIYGFGVKGNLHALMRAVDRGWPLPLGAIKNRRSLLAMENLIDAVKLCLTHPNAGNVTYLLSDDHPVSSSELVVSIASAMRRRAKILSVPVWTLRAAGHMLGRSAAIERLTSSLVVDSTAIRERLGWRPNCTFEQAIAEMVEGYRCAANPKSAC
jgi:UDP-glucose 4-epimerase